MRVERHRNSRAQSYIHDQSEVAILPDRLIAMFDAGHHRHAGEEELPDGRRRA